MPEIPLQQLMLQARHLEAVCEILHRHLPAAEVWAFGSRVNGNGHEASDLDLAARNPRTPGQSQRGLAEARTAFIESNLPIRVDLQDWALMPDSLHRDIEGRFAVLQRAERDSKDGVSR